MSNIRNLKLEVVLSAIDKATRPIKAVMGSSSGLSKQLKDTKDKLKELNQAQGSISAFRTLTKDAKTAGETLVAARQKLKEMNAQMAAVGPPTEAMTRKLKSAEIAVEKLTLANRKKIDAAKAAKLALDANGISAAKLGAHERELAAKIELANAAMERQQDKLAKLSAMQNRQRTARSRYEQSLENRDRIAGAGATTMAAGTAAGLPIVKMVRDYSSYEDAMLGVARQVEGARDANGKLTATYYQMGDAIKAMAEKIPMATTEIAALVEGGARMGIKGKADLLAFAKTAALASTAFDLPADQISEDLGKIANTYKIPIKNIEQLGDVINYLDDNAQSKGADIINVMQRIAGSTGNMNFKEAAALGSTFLSLGASAEVAATATKAMVRELAIAEKQPKRFQAGLKELGLNAKQVQADMAKDSTGTILKVMEAVKKLPEAARMGVMVDLFGKEYGDDAAKLAGSLDEYRKQLALVNEAKAKGSMRREGDAKDDTLSAQWQMLQNKIFNQSSGLGSSLRQPLIDIMATVGQLTDKFTAWTKANPELTATLVKIAAVLAAVMVAAGGVMLAIAGIIGPFLAARFAMTMFGIQLTSGIGIIGRLGSAVQFGGGLLKGFFSLLRANPFFALAAFLTGFVMHFVTNWDRLKQMWTQGDWKGIGVFILQGLEAGLNAMTMGLYGTIKRIISGVISLVMDILGIHSPSRVFAQIGEYLMAGLVNGITSGLASVKKAITGAGESTIGWFKQKLGIHSPSRVFAELGGFTMEGLQQGITGGQGGPLGAVMSMAKRLTAAGAGIAIGAASGLAGAVTMDMRPPISAGRPAAQASAPDNVFFNIYQAPGQSPQELARVIEQMMDARDRKKAASGRSRLTDKD